MEPTPAPLKAVAKAAPALEVEPQGIENTHATYEDADEIEDSGVDGLFGVNYICPIM